MAETTSTRSLRCLVVTPEATVLDETADFVAVPLFDGEQGILPGKSPIVGRLGFGELRITSQGKTIRHYVDGGFVQVQNNVVSILTSNSIAKDKLAVEVARHALMEAKAMHGTTPELSALRDTAVSQARAQLRLAEKSPS